MQTNSCMDPKSNKKSSKSSKKQPLKHDDILKLIVRGHRYDANKILTQKPKILILESDVMDYSGRIFKNITPYEYAYWAKDTHACRMLESHMDAKMKANMLARCEAIEENGLKYKQYGKLIENSAHFDFSPLILALKKYAQGYNLWLDTGNWTAMGSALLTIGWEQRNVPVHVAQEFCRMDRSFDPLPDFNESYLPESLSVYNYRTEGEEVWFPLKTSDANGLGIDFSIIFTERGSRRCYVVHRQEKEEVFWDSIGRWLAWRESAGGEINLAAITRLDAVRTADLKQSLANLK